MKLSHVNVDVYIAHVIGFLHISHLIQYSVCRSGYIWKHF